MVNIEGQNLLDSLKNHEDVKKFQELIALLPLVFVGETLFKGTLCITNSLINKLMDLLIKAKKDLQKIDVEIKQELLVIKIAIKRKNTLYKSILKIKKIEINENNKFLYLHLNELPKFYTSNIFQNFVVGVGTMITNLSSAEEFIIKYLIGNKQGIEVTDKNISIDITKMPYICEIYNKELFGLSFLDVVDIKDAHIKEGVIEIDWEVALPSANYNF